MTNQLINMFDIDSILNQIKNCPKDEVVILLPHYSINKCNYLNDSEDEDWDFFELEEILNCTISVTDYDDLVADPHGILN
jgi:hypothetical protein